MKLIAVLILFVFLMTGCVAQSKPQTVENTPVNFSNSELSYSEKLKSIETKRLELANEYRQSPNKKAVLEKAQKVLVSSIYNEIFPA